MQKLENIQACVFDAYGTLFDVHSAVGKLRSRLGGAAERLSAIWRTKQLEYTWLRSLMGTHADFWTVTGEALDFAMETTGVSDPGLREALLEAYLALDSYPEVKPTLEALREKGVPSAILSNGSPRMLEAAVASAGLSSLIDAIYSVEEVGIFKPHPRVYRLACDGLRLEPRQVSFQSSNAWDVAGAASFGMTVVWVNRFDQKRERLPGRADAELGSLAGLPDLL